MAETKDGANDAVTAPARKAYPVTPSDTTILDPTTKALLVGVDGDLALLAIDDTVPVTLRNVPSQSTVDVRAAKVMATGTTAANITALA